MTQNQHRIPRMLLKQFASDRSRRKIYEKNVHADTPPREICISNATTELNAYPGTTEEKLKRIEDRAGRVINRLAKAYRLRKTTGEDENDLVVRKDEKEPLALFFKGYMFRSSKAQMLRVPTEKPLSDAEITEYRDAAITDDGLAEKFLGKEFRVLPVLSDGEYFILGGTGVPVADEVEDIASTFFFPVSSWLCIALGDSDSKINECVRWIAERSSFVYGLNECFCRMHVSPCIYGRTGELLNIAFHDNIRRHYSR